MKIESLQNAKVKEWNKLKEKKYRDASGLFLIEGDHLLKEAIKRNAIQEIIATDSSFQIGNFPFYEVTNAIMNKLSSQVTSSKVMAVCKKSEAKEIKGRVCLLDNIQDPGNLGTIIRSALAFGIDTIILSRDTVDLYNDKTIRASEGMIFSLNFIKNDLKEIILELQKEDYTIYGTNVKEGQECKAISFPEKCGIIIGNEGNGMQKELMDMCDELIHIKIDKRCESLNAGIAASIIFYEMKGK